MWNSLVARTTEQLWNCGCNADASHPGVPMKASAAILREQPGKWEVVEVGVDEPQAHEVLVRTIASGLCHSDDYGAAGDQRWLRGHGRGRQHPRVIEF